LRKEYGSQKEGEEEVWGGRQQDREEGHARAETRFAEIRSFEEEGKEPQASDRHRSIRSARGRREGAEEAFIQEEGFTQEETVFIQEEVFVGIQEEVFVGIQEEVLVGHRDQE
jgi:hypothetical protein